jgi:response regulator RpfG family c-di-GMP phosphodiesterase/signal transduction histidine kinase
MLDDFKKETFEKGIRDIRVSASISSVAFLLFSILDRFVYPELSGTFLLIRTLVLIGNAIILLFTFIKNASKHSMLLKIVAYLLYSSSIIVMVNMTGGYLSPYFAGLNIVLIGFMFLMPLDGFRTIVVCLIVYIGYLLPILLGQKIEQRDIFLNNNFFLLTTMILAIASSFLSTRMHMKEFEARYNLAKANEDLKKLDKLKTRFFANVSHEVRTPLTSIIAPLQSLRQGDVGSLNLDQGELLDQIHRNAVRLLDLINQMLDFSKLEAGKVHLRLSYVDMAEYTGEIVSLFREVSTRKGLKLSFETAPETSEPMYIDRDRYERIITNLIRNSVKFTESGGLTVGLKKSGDMMELTVADTGIGIPKEDLPKIFNRFEQVDGTSTRSYEGTGLGLAIVDESVKLLHGTIKVESVEDVGSVFTISIPLNLADHEPHAFVERRNSDRRNRPKKRDIEDRRNDERRRDEFSSIPVSQLAQVESLSYPVHNPSEPSVPAVSSGRRILLAEDTDDLRHYIAKILTKLGHQVVTRENGLAAWNYLKEEGSVDLLVTDLMMPKMDGYELLQAVRSDEKMGNLPVILITAKAGDDPKLKALGIGADDYLPKPINVRELDARIRNLLTTRELVRAEADTAVMEHRIEELMLSFAQTLELRDVETGNHCRGVLELGTGIAAELGLPVDRTLKASLLLHDVGKIGIPDSILLKASRLDDREMEVIKQHPGKGRKLLESLTNFREVSDIIFAHQEHWDGTGYPEGLKGEQIPLIARIIAVADAFHAMTNTRPYRKALTERAAIEELRKNKGTQFDPEVVDAFIRSKSLV